MRLLATSARLLAILPPATYMQSRRALAVAAQSTKMEVDSEYPGTAVARMRAAHGRVSSLSKHDLSGDWEDVRRRILWAAGLRDLPNSQPGQGFTGHAFNDANHCDATTMLGEVAHNLNDGAVG